MNAYWRRSQILSSSNLPVVDGHREGVQINEEGVELGGGRAGLIVPTLQIEHRVVVLEGEHRPGRSDACKHCLRI